MGRLGVTALGFGHRRAEHLLARWKTLSKLICWFVETDIEVDFAGPLRAVIVHAAFDRSGQSGFVASSTTASSFSQLQGSNSPSFERG